MKILYLDCAMGAAGDMLAAALWELLPEKAAFLEKINSLGLPGVTVGAEKSEKCGITGTHYAVSVHGQEEGEGTPPATHTHGTLHDIQHLIWGLDLPARVRADALAVYQAIAEAEARVHGVEEVHQIHFHEVGTMDAVADVVSVCYLMYLLRPDRVMASPVCVGSGWVRCAHGLLPVPAPATARLLEGIPIYAGDLTGELCTPTGAALLRHFAREFGPLPAMTLQGTGYGMGKKDFPRANCLRAMLGESGQGGDAVLELSCNLDDMTGEAMGFAMESLLAAGALDVFFAPVTMKKSRPGILLTVLCHPEDRADMVRAIFRHTTTLGIREAVRSRYTLSRETVTRQTPLGPVREKRSSGYGAERRKPEYEDLAQIARERGMSLEEVVNATGIF